ncbi:aspartate/glutamate racemase family protein [Candidatus Woesearchaeota archaeon]|nr:aspartate/glutamate racemase family protein [Candidatus Woesearchaeota archaeon]
MVNIIGILGGLGPEATNLLYEKIIKYTKAEKDQDHIPVLIYSNPKIHDRMDYNKKTSQKLIINDLISSAKQLEKNKVSFILIPCNTAHYWIEEMKKKLKTSVIDMIAETLNYVIKKYRCRKIGLLARTGTVNMGLFQKYCNRYNIELILPDEKEQELTETIVRKIKAGNYSKKDTLKIKKIIKNLENQGAKKILLGCTELPLLFKQLPKKLIDPMDILAVTAIKKCRKNTSKGVML